MAEISAVLTRPSEDAKFNPRHRYILRGVSTEPHITYVLCAVEDEGEGGGEGEGEGASNSITNQEVQEGHETGSAGPTTRYQWWKLSFSSGDPKPVSKTVSQKNMD